MKDADRETRVATPAATGSSSAQTERLCSRAVRLSLMLASWLLLVGVVAHWVHIRFLGDVWWLGNIALYAPRWPLFAPLAVIALLCAVWMPKLLWFNFGTGLMLLVLVMGFCVPMSSSATEKPDELRLRVMTVNAGNATAELLRRELTREAPDVVAFQEFGRLEPSELLDEGWYWQVAGGTAIASRYPIKESDTFSARRVGRWGDMALGVQLKLPVGNVWVYSLHLNTPRWGLEGLAITRDGLIGLDSLRTNMQERDSESRTIREWTPDSDVPAIIAGDFNMPVESWFYRRDWSHHQNAFSVAGLGLGHTKFMRRHSVRIDHILANEYWRVKDSHVAGKTGGDHAPVVADLARRKK